MSRSDKERLAVLPHLDGVGPGWERRGFLINNPGGNIHPDQGHGQHGRQAEGGNGGADRQGKADFHRIILLIFSLVIIIFIKILIMFFGAIRTDAMTEFGFGSV